MSLHFTDEIKVKQSSCSAWVKLNTRIDLHTTHRTTTSQTFKPVPGIGHRDSVQYAYKDPFKNARVIITNTKGLQM